MKKLIWLLPTLALSTNIPLTMANTNVNVVKNFSSMNAQLNPLDSTNGSSLMWTGMALQYFLMVNSDIKENEYIKNNLLPMVKKSGVKEKQTDFFLMSLIGNAVVISQYGMSSYQEFFAEAYSMWTTLPDQAKNLSWELLNHFFITIYPQIIKTYNSYLSDDLWVAIQNLIEQDAKNNESKLKTTIKAPTSGLTYNDLMYRTSEFGYLDRRENGYQVTAVNNSLLFAEQATPNAKGISAIRLRFVRLFTNEYDSSQIANFAYNTVTKAKQDSIDEFYNYLKIAKNDFYTSFSDLSNAYQKQTINTTNLATMITSMGNYYSWNQTRTRDFENQILDLFNFCFEITKLTSDQDNYFWYYLLGVAMTPDSIGNGVMGVTKTSMLSNGFNQVISSAYGSVVLTGQAFNMVPTENSNQQYQLGWWSSPNRFATINHEFGHVLDGYVSLSTQGKNYIVQKNIHRNFLKNYRKNVFDGLVFGVDVTKSDNHANLGREIGIAVGAIVGIFVVGSVTFGIVYKKRKSTNKS